MKGAIATGPNYDAAFVSATALARDSARHVIPHVLKRVPVRSVVDFGCALGTWLSVWQDAGITDVLGVDGDYLHGQPTEIDPRFIRYCDLSQSLDLGRKFDLVQSLEVAEHLPSESADTFIDSLTQHGDLILFSAAPPGQGGDQHINEQPYDYWRALFQHRGYSTLDWLRPTIAADSHILYWYRYNTFLFANESALAKLPADMLACKVPIDQKVRDISPLSFRIRKELIRHLPTQLENWIAHLVSKVRTGRWRKALDDKG